MELYNEFSCKQSNRTAKIILGFGKQIITLPHQTFGHHSTSDVHEVGSSVDVMALNSLTGDMFIAESKSGRIICVDLSNNSESVLVDQDIMSVKAMDFGKFSFERL